MAFQNFPYTDLHTLNLDWILKTVRELQEAWNGFQVNWGQDVAEQVDKWLEEHPEEYQAMRANGRKYVKEKYSWYAITNRFAELINQVSRDERGE